MSIIKIIGINQYTIAIYYTSAECYKYAIIDDDGTVYEPDEIFYTAATPSIPSINFLSDYLSRIS